MRKLHRLSPLVLFVAALTFAGCGKDEPTKGPTDAHSDGHHKPPNGGEVLELGTNEEGHLEVMHDHKGGNITVWVYGSGFDKPLSVERPTVTIQTTTGQQDLVLTPVDAKADGTAHHWKGQHDGLKVDPWDGRIIVKIGDKVHRSPLEGAGHDHK